MNKALLLCTIILVNMISPAVFAATVAPAVSHNQAVAQKVKNQLNKSPLLNNQDITVQSQNRVVTLSGEVETDMQYEQAIVLAGSVKGVSRIDVEGLKVKSSQAPLKDTYITAKVKTLYFKTKLFNGNEIEVWPVKVETKNGVVYLSGNIASNKEKQRLIKLAKSVKGVKRVKSALTVDHA
jgi:hyperosmotically inducible protein